jgi:hypothetical protein
MKECTMVFGWIYIRMMISLSSQFPSHPLVALSLTPMELSQQKQFMLSVDNFLQ